MADFQNHLECPRCRRWANHTAHRNEDYEKKGRLPFSCESESAKRTSSGVPVGFIRERECTSCEAIWHSIELPLDFVQAVVEVVSKSAAGFDAFEALASWNSHEPWYYCLEEDKQR